MTATRGLLALLALAIGLMTPTGSARAEELNR